jgi:hypothetical protein
MIMEAVCIGLRSKNALEVVKLMARPQNSAFSFQVACPFCEKAARSSCFSRK